MIRDCILKRFRCRQGVTFIEIMVTLSIFSFGFIAIFKTFFTSLERIERITQRIYAHTLLDNRIGEIERALRIFQALPLQGSHSDALEIGFKRIIFKEDLKISAVEDYADTFQVDLKLSWDDDGKTHQVSRSAYISDPEYIQP